VQGYDEASYGEGIADVYDDWYADVSDVEGAVRLLAGLAGAGHAFELGIGTGRVALPLAASGVTVSGIDASPSMVAVLRAKPGGDAITVTIGDMAGPLPVRDCSVVFVTYNTFFNLVSEEAQRRCLASVAGALRPGGRFVVEGFVPADGAAATGLQVRSIELDRVVLTASRHDAASQTAFGQHVELVDGRPVRLRPWKVRYVTPDQLDAMAATAGFGLVSRTEGWRDEPFTEDSTQHVSVYRLGGAVASDER
jgi:SAM-dependent methyltransferase